MGTKEMRKLQDTDENIIIITEKFRDHPSLPCHHLQDSKSAIQSSRNGRFLLLARNVSFSLAQWARDLVDCLTMTSSKEQTMTCPGQASFESYLCQGQVGIQGLPSPDLH